MIDGQSVLAVIAARGGSKRVPGKNLRLVGGKPLIAWTIDAARQSTSIDRIVLSSDDPEIVRASLAFGCEAPFQRPAHLATDDAASVDVVLDALQRVSGFDIVVLLQPTSPLRNHEDIDGTLRAMHNARAPSGVSVTPVEHGPTVMFTVTSAGTLEPLSDLRTSPRSASSPLVMLNGAVYAVRCDWFLRTRAFVTEETVPFVMPRSRSVDIDTEEDLLLCESLIQRADV